MFTVYEMENTPRIIKEAYSRMLSNHLTGRISAIISTTDIEEYNTLIDFFDAHLDITVTTRKDYGERFFVVFVW